MAALNPVFQAKRGAVLILMSAPGYLVNLASVAALVSYLHFSGLGILSPVILGDIIAVAVNLSLFDYYWLVVRRLKLVRETQARCPHCNEPLR